MKFLILFLLFSGVQAGAKTYYVSNQGKDSNSGTRMDTPWKTIAQVMSQNYTAGDQILFAGGQTFNGQLKFTAQSSGVCGLPIKIGSYGVGRANIRVEDGDGLYLYNTKGYVVSNINFLADPKNRAHTANGNGIRVYTDLPENKKLSCIRIDHTEVSGFHDHGIQFGSLTGSSGFNLVSITNSTIHDDGNAGIEFYASYPGINDAHSNVYIAHNRVYNNLGYAGTPSHSGDGIVIGGVSQGTLEYNTAFSNGVNNTAEGGPVGIWAWSSTAIMIQHNESYGNRTNSRADGGGFDLDGGVTNSVMQYNYSHDNDGPGFLLATFDAAATSGNTVRCNVSKNDSRKNNYGAITLFGKVDESEIYNNKIYLSAAKEAVKIDTVAGSKNRLGDNLVNSGNSSRLPASQGFRSNFKCKP